MLRLLHYQNNLIDNKIWCPLLFTNKTTARNHRIFRPKHASWCKCEV